MKLLQPMVFAIAFILVTGVLIFLNTMYANIFKFDFSAPASVVQVSDSTKTTQPKDTLVTLKQNPIIKDTSAIVTASKDSIIKKDSLKNNQPLTDNIVNNSPAKTEIKDTVPETTYVSLPQQIPAGSETDSNYVKWVKATAALYESMDPKKAAKIIQNYSEKTAREIIYKMKKKKAAEVLAELDPMLANRIARY
jgi:catalase